MLQLSQFICVLLNKVVKNLTAAKTFNILIAVIKGKIQPFKMLCHGCFEYTLINADLNKSVFKTAMNTIYNST